MMNDPFQVDAEVVVLGGEGPRVLVRGRVYATAHSGGTIAVRVLVKGGGLVTLTHDDSGWMLGGQRVGVECLS